MSTNLSLFVSMADYFGIHFFIASDVLCYEAHAVFRSVYIQGVTGGMCETSGECSLGQTIPI